MVEEIFFLLNCLPEIKIFTVKKLFFPDSVMKK